MASTVPRRQIKNWVFALLIHTVPRLEPHAAAAWFEWSVGGLRDKILSVILSDEVAPATEESKDPYWMLFGSYSGVSTRPAKGGPRSLNMTTRGRCQHS